MTDEKSALIAMWELNHHYLLRAAPGSPVWVWAAQALDEYEDLLAWLDSI